MLPWDATGNQLRKTISKCNSQISELKREREELRESLKSLMDDFKREAELETTRSRARIWKRAAKSIARLLDPSSSRGNDS